VAMEDARPIFKRMEQQRSAAVISAQDFDAAKSAYDTAQSAYASQQAAVEAARASLRVAERAEDDMTVRAPFSGVVTDKAAQPGEMVSPLSAGGSFTRTGIGTIVDMDSLEIQVDVNEAFINRVTPGQPVEATLNAYPDWKIPGEVIAIIPTADRSKATVKVRIAIKARDARIVPDMGVRVAFLESRATNAGQATSRPGANPAAVRVPTSAIRGQGGEGVAFVYRDGRVERRSVTLGPVVGANREVTRGLADGERVVVSPPDSLKDGDPVKLLEGG